VFLLIMEGAYHSRSVLRRHYRIPQMTSPNIDQWKYWNEMAGPSWVKVQPKLDRQMAPLGLAAIDALSPRPGEKILDIGCGAGATALELARRVGAGGKIVGIDISVPLITLARERAAGIGNLEILEGDAGKHVFPQPFDAAFSRFGVMFFPAPVAAFAGIKANLRAGGRLCFICWRALTDNPAMMVPLNAALRHLPPLPPPDPEAPGPASLADPQRIRAILSQAGFTDIGINQNDMMVGAISLDEAMDLALCCGPLGAMLREHPDQRDIVMNDVREALAAHHGPDGVRFSSATWIVRAS
jgi:SAM-dependent methyltransferase